MMCSPGMITMWGGTTATIPAGWLLCNGALVSTTSYPALFQAVGFSFGASPPAGQFYLPDLRSRFVRGADDGANRDPDLATRTDMQNTGLAYNGVGSIQADAFQNHIHAYNSFPDGSGNIASGRYWSNGTATTAPVDPALYRTSSETRPVNAYLNFIIAT